jgi:hypothetical protein
MMRRGIEIPFSSEYPGIEPPDIAGGKKQATILPESATDLLQNRKGVFQMFNDIPQYHGITGLGFKVQIIDIGAGNVQAQFVPTVVGSETGNLDPFDTPPVILCVLQEKPCSAPDFEKITPLRNMAVDNPDMVLKTFDPFVTFADIVCIDVTRKILLGIEHPAIDSAPHILKSALHAFENIVAAMPVPEPCALVRADPAG